MSIFPDIFRYFAFRMLVRPLTITNIVFKLAFINLSIIPSEFSPAMLQVVLVLAFKYISIKRTPKSLSFSFSHNKWPLEYATVLPLVSSDTMVFPLRKRSDINISIRLLFNTLSMFKALSNFAFKGMPIFGHHDSFASLFPLLKVADILVSLIINMLSKAMRLAIHPLTVVSHETMTLVTYYLDHAPSTPVPIIESAQIVVLVWHVLEAYSFLFRSTWSLIIPLTQVKRAIEVSNYILVWFQLIIDSILKFVDYYLLLEFSDINIEDFIYFCSLLLERLQGVCIIRVGWRKLGWYLKLLVNFGPKIIMNTSDLPTRVFHKYRA